MYLVPIILWVLDPGYAEWDAYTVRMTHDVVLISTLTVFCAISVTALGFYIGQNSKVKINFGKNLFSFESLRVFCLFYGFLYFTLYLVIIFLSGGIGDFIAQGIESRGGGSSLGLSGYIRYFLISGEVFIPYAILFAFKTRGYRLIKIIFFLLFLFAVFTVSISTGSRAALIYPFMVLFFYWLLCSERLNVKLLLAGVFVFIVGLTSVNYAKVFLYGVPMPDHTFESFLNSAVSVTYHAFSYFKHYLITIAVVYSDPEVYEFPRAGLDYFRAFVEVLPGVGKHDVDFLGLTSIPAELNKEYLGGTGYVPPGWIAFALMNGGMIFLVIYGIFSSFLGGVVDRSLPVDSSNRGVAAAHKVLFFFAWFRIFYAQDPWQVLLANFGIYLMILVWLFSFRVRFVFGKK